ncbi:hypothetical protein JMG10_13275 [Nostoc ellipsosporum NOK]|nr:hypothetical protein [Nostoc ellipsosporum NOK]
MICPGCNTPGVVHAGGRGENPPCADWPRCPRCNAANDGARNYREGRTRDICEELGVCYVCAIREERARDYAAGKAKNTLIIDGYTYSADRANSVPLGNPDPRPGTPMRGMAGRRFDIERFDGTPPFSCYSLWAGGPVDEWSRERMPDNARFLNGAKRVNASGITCFNGSSEAAASQIGGAA